MNTPTARPAAPRHRLRTDERRREIVAAVLELARERGPDSITTQAIADRIGVTQGALFRHFPDKEAIWLAVFAWVRESLGAVLDDAIRVVGVIGAGSEDHRGEQCRLRWCVLRCRHAEVRLGRSLHATETLLVRSKAAWRRSRTRS